MLSIRLMQVARLIKDYESMADIGCDHALLPIYLLEKKYIHKAVGIDIGQKPLAKARYNAERKNVFEHLDLRLGDGLSPLKPHEVDVINICGMGGRLIARILEKDMTIFLSAKRLYLMPQKDEAFLRNWLSDHGCLILNEYVILDNNRFYILMVVEPQGGESLSALECAFGPVLLNKFDPLTCDYFQKRKDRDRKICQLWASYLNDEKHFHLEKQIDETQALWNAWEEKRCQFK